MGERDINEVLRSEGVDAARVMHDEARAFETEGAVILNAVRSFLSRFVVYPSEHAKIAHALWVAHAHLMGAWESTPRIAFLSPEPGSGKTRAMEVTELLVPNPVAAVNVTPAYLFRKVGSENGPPTILFDEIDTVFGPKAREHEELRALLNSGHRRGAVAGRCVVRGKIIETEEIPSYAAVALAGLGWLPPTILSRSVIVRMRRRAPDEKIESFRSRTQAPIGKALRRRLATWAEAILQEATDARPEMPVGVEDRNADVWEALLAVADLAGGDWPNLSRRAATELVKAAREIEPSLNIRLLEDLRTIFEGEDSLSTKDVLARLCLLEDAPWNDLKGKPITDRQLSQQLGPYGVRLRTLRFELNLVAKGYRREDLHDVWRRYLPSLSPEPVTSVTDQTTQAFQDGGHTRGTSCAASEALQPLQNGGQATPVTPSVTASRASAASEHHLKMGVATDVTHVTHLAGNGGGPSLGQWPEARKVGRDGELKPQDPPLRRTRI